MRGTRERDGAGLRWRFGGPPARSGAFAGVVAAGLLAVAVPFAIGLAGSVAAPRAWARRAREREVLGHRRLASGAGEVRVVRLGETALQVRVVRLGAGVYAEAVPVGDRGAVVLDGAKVDEVVARGAEVWGRDAGIRRARERAGAGCGDGVGGAERAVLVGWLVGTGMPPESAEEVFR